jgi:hypothetical protein
MFLRYTVMSGVLLSVLACGSEEAEPAPIPADDEYTGPVFTDDDDDDEDDVIPDLGPPVISDIKASPTSLDQFGVVKITVLAHDPDGMEDVPGGELTDDKGNVYGAIKGVGVDTFAIELTWEQINTISELTFDGNTSRTFTATIADQRGQSDSMDVTVDFQCFEEENSCAGECSNLDVTEHCGACFSPCPGTDECVQGECSDGEAEWSHEVSGTFDADGGFTGEQAIVIKLVDVDVEMCRTKATATATALESTSCTNCEFAFDITFGVPSAVDWGTLYGTLPGQWTAGWYGYGGQDVLYYSGQNADVWDNLTTFGWSVEADATSTTIDYRIYQPYSLW